MSATTKIPWCDSTLNFWSGCAKVSAGCQNCYAETLSNRKLTDGKGNRTLGQWGQGAPRRLHESAFRQAFTLNRKPWLDAAGQAYTFPPAPAPNVHRRRIFSLSLGDWLDPEVPIEWLARMLDTLRQCDQVTWILCTKRPENFFSRVEAALDHGLENEDWLEAWAEGKPPGHIILLASVENQPMADERIPHLLRIPAACHGISAEPLLGPITPFLSHQSKQVDWIIAGGESGPHARPCNVGWIRSLVAQGQAAGGPVFVKQLGAFSVEEQGSQRRRNLWVDRKGGDPSEWPADLRVREFPTVNAKLTDRR